MKKSLFCIGTLFVAAATAYAATWTGASSTDWTDGGNWDASVPAAGDDVIIPAGVANMPLIPAGTWPASGAYGSFTVTSGATVTCLGDATAVNAASGGTAAMPHGIGVTINCASANISGRVSADNQGFPAKGGPGGWGEGACYGGPPHLDNILYPTHYWGAGRGSAGSSFQQPYGSVTEPTALGSGGSGVGGGAVKIAASGAVTVDGSITALAAARGSGGSIWIAAGTTFGGSGTINASGDNQTRGGSGGRVSITCSTANWSGTISVAGGDASHSDGAPGTLWAPWLFADKLGTAENPVNVTLSENYSYVFPDTTTPHYWNLTVPAGVHSELHSGFLHLGTLTVQNGARFRLDNWGPGTGDDIANFDVKSIILEGTAQAALPSCSVKNVYDLDSLSLASGSLLYVGWGDKTDINESSGGTAVHPHGSGVTIRCANPVIAGTLSAKGRGFGARPARDNNTIPCPVFSTEGNGHGGKSEYTAGYGQISRPTALGSGNYAYAAGGAIKMEVSGTLSIDGTITADGAEERSTGGSIWIQANAISGSGTISASGNYMNRNAAGGRVAVEAVDISSFSGSVLANGSRSTLNIAYPGSVFYDNVANVSEFGWSADDVTVSSDYSYSVNDQTIFPDLTKTASGSEAYVEALVVERNVTSWDTNANVYVWTESCATKAGTAVANIATYKLSGLPAEKFFVVKVNGDVLDGYSSVNPSASGTLEFSADLIVAGSVVDVRSWEPPPVVDGISATCIDDGRIDFASVLAECGTVPAIGYLYCGTTDGGTVASDWDAVVPVGTFRQLDDIHGIFTPPAPGTMYYGRICASNEYGISWSDAASVTSWTAPALGTYSLGSVSDVDAHFTLELADGTGAMLGVEISDGNGECASEFTGATSLGSYQIVIDDLTPDTQYSWCPVASNIFGVVRGSSSNFSTVPTITARSSAGDGRWDDPTSWTPQGLPRASEDITILSGHTITIDIDGAVADSLSVASGATLVFDGWNSLLTVGNVTVDGTVTHVANTATSVDGNGEWIPNGRVNVACSTFTVNQGGLVDGKGLGFAGAPSGTAGPGMGPGGGAKTGDGGSHGGFGGITVQDVRDVCAATYDSVTVPALPGSGGANQDKKFGGNGGGVVRIIASGVVTVNGSIDVDGCHNTASGNHWSGGAGGSVYIVCSKILGAGSITANGADSRYVAGAGGGGRIAIDYDSAAQAAESLPALRIQAMGGGASYEQTLVAGQPRYGTTGGAAGTLWFPDSQFLTRFATTGGTFRLAGLWAAEGAPSTLTVNGDVFMDNGALAFADQMNLTIDGNLTISGRAVSTTTASLLATLWSSRLDIGNGSLTVNGNFCATNAMLRMDSSDCIITGNVDVVRARFIVDSDGVKRPSFTVGGDASFNASYVHVASGAEETVPVVMSGLTTSGGSLFTVGGTLTLAAKSFVYPHSNRDNGSSPWFHLGALNVDSTSGFNAFGLGYPGYIWAAGSGHGPGGGFKTKDVKYLGSGGYGGIGGNATNDNGVAYGATYGVATAPFGPGSSAASGERYAPSAGGAIRIYCEGDVVLNGTMNANGANSCPANWYAGSSGGAVWLICRKIYGTNASSAITAHGGDGSGGNSSVGGGGGRVAVWTGKVLDVADNLFAKLLAGNVGYARELVDLPEWAGNVDVTAGVLYTKGAANTIQVTPPGDGTVVFLKLSGRPSTVLLVQ